MPKIICTIAGAPPVIGGASGVIDFEPTDAGMVADVDDADADYFLSIPGYALVDDGKKTAAEDAERDALLARAMAVSMDVDRRWKLPRLRSEVEHAEKLAAG